MPWVDIEAHDQCFRLRIRLGVQPDVGMAVTSQKALEAKYVAVIGAADNDRSADTCLEQADATQDQRTHDAFAEISFGYQQRPKQVRWNEQSFDRPSCMGVHETGVQPVEPALP